MARCGVASRRKAEELIESGLVTVNGKVINAPGHTVDGNKDWVKVDGKSIKPEKPVYYVMNKPAGTVCTASDEKERKTVIDIIKPAVKERVYPVGRLDYNTTGCLLITNDGEWANKITHPGSGIPKRYTAKIRGRASRAQVEKLIKGITVEGRKMKAKDAGIINKGKANDTVFVTITEGMNHQVKKMMAALGMPPVWLKRSSVGKITVKGLEPGQFRRLNKEEISYFK